MTDKRSSVRTIGRYQIVSELGRGAMGIVYRGYDPVIRRTVALKTMSFAADDAESVALRQRLYREAAAAGTLVHPNIVTVYDIVEDGAATAVAMELVEGETLASYIAGSGPLPFDQAIWIFEQVCSALDYAGSKGIVHRDIKPANILLTPEGHPKIMDFGIARMALAGVTQTSTIMGSPSYMSPEQVRGLALDSRSDLFSAAVVFYEMISGQRPFVGDDVATTMYRIVSGAPQAIDQFVPAMPPAVSRVIEWALSKERADRPQTGRDLVDALRRAAAPGPGSTAVHAQPFEATAGGFAGHAAYPPELVVPGDARAAKRSPWLLAGVIASGLLFIGTVAAFVIMRSGQPAQPPIGGGGLPAAAVPATESAGSGPTPGESAATADIAGHPSPERPTGTETRPSASDLTGVFDEDRPGARTASATAEPSSRRPVPSGEAAATAAEAPTSVTTVTVVTSGGASPVSKTPAAPPAVAPRQPPPAVEEPATASRVKEPAAIVAAAGSGGARVQVEFEGAPYAVTLFAGETRLGRVEAESGSVAVEPGSVRLRAVSEPLFLDMLLPPVTVRAGERRSIAVPGLCSAAFGLRGEDYTGVRLVIDGRQVPGPYPAQVPQIAAGTHRVVYRWASGPAAGREVSGNITLAAGGHFLVRAALDNDTIVVQQLR